MLKQTLSLYYATFVVLHGLPMSTCTCKETRMNDYLFAQIEQSISQLKQSTNCGKDGTKYGKYTLNGHIHDEEALQPLNPYRNRLDYLNLVLLLFM